MQQSSSSSPMLRSLLVSTVFLSSALISGVDASSEISFFRQNSCNAGTGFYSWSNPNPLTSDVKCHPVPAGAVALYISDIDEGCTIRTYNGFDCQAATLSGLLVNAGTCFYPDEAKAVMGSWRADCMGIDYTDSDAEDHGNSYSSSAPGEGGEGEAEDGADPAHVVSVLATATGPVTIAPSQTSDEHVTKTVVPVSASSSSEVDSTTGTATTPAARTTASSAASTTSSSVPNDAGLSCQRSDLRLMTSVGLMLALAGILV